MAQESTDIISRFDQVSLLTTKNVSYISAPVGNPDPNGAWVVAGLIGNDLIVTKDGVLIRIPATDVEKLVDYNRTMRSVYDKLGDILGYGKRKEDPSGNH
jgi:hypothetical protein